MGKVVDLPVITTLDLNPDRVLANLDGKLKGFVIAGYDHNGDLYFSSTYADGAEVLWLIEQLKKTLLD